MSKQLCKLVLAGLFMVGALAIDAPAEAATWHTAKILSVYPQSEGSFVLVFNANSPACASGNPDYFYVRAGQNNVTLEGQRAMLTVATAAMLSGKEVAISFDESSSNCWVNRMQFPTIPPFVSLGGQ